MNYQEKQNKLNKEAWDFLKQHLFNKKEAILTEKMSYFFHEQAQKLIENPEILKVINFEFDSIMHFSYAAYPDPYFIPQKYWKDQFSIGCGHDDYDAIENMCKALKLEEWDDAYVLIEDDNYFIDKDELLNQLHYSYFENAWRKAKAATGVNYRGFLFWHDVYVGIDLDTGKGVRGEDVVNILREEQFDFTILEE